MKKNNIIDRFFKKIWSYDKKNTIFIFFIFCTLIIIWELFSYTVLNYDFYRNLADNQQIWKVIVPVTRGTIYSENSNATIMWTSLNLYDISIDPKSIWDKLKLTNYLTDIVYKEVCYDKEYEICYNNVLKFIRQVEIEDFNIEKDYIKELIFNRLKDKIYQEKVTSVYVDKQLNEEKRNSIKLSWLEWLYIVNDYLYINPEEIKNEEFTINLLTEVLW
jgi:cell division protein FtsI/penicillin-binding protein 2